MDDVFGKELTAERLALMKLEARDFLSDAGSPGIGHKHMDFSDSHSMTGGRSISRQFSRSARRSSSFLAAHRSKMSTELTASAESKFFALMELMASASREATSLKEVWAKLISERESWAEERQELLEQVTKFSSELDHWNTERHRHGDEAVETKKKLEKLLLDISIALAGLSAEKKKVADRDHELGKIRRQLIESQESVTRHHNGMLVSMLQIMVNGVRREVVEVLRQRRCELLNLERTRAEHESLTLALANAESERHSARDEVDRLQRELHKAVRERTEISSRVTDITNKYETSHRDVLSLTDRLKMSDLESGERLREVDRFKEDIRKLKTKAEDYLKETIEVSETSDRLQRDLIKYKETVRTVELERDELTSTLEHVRRESKTVLANYNESEDRNSELSLKYEHLKRELLSIKDNLRAVELERSEMTELVERTREQHRLVVVERDELKDGISTAERKAHDNHRRTIVLEESLRRHESTLLELRSEISSLSDRIKSVIIERDDARHHHGGLQHEIAELKEKVVIFQAEIRSITESRDRIRSDLEKTRAEYEELTEELTTYEGGGNELEFEIESLRTLLREAREQKEIAIAARNTADRERDEHVTKYEEKCRELERFEEDAASHYHAHSSSNHGEGKTTTRRVFSTRSNNTTIHNGAG